MGRSVDPIKRLLRSFPKAVLLCRLCDEPSRRKDKRGVGYCTRHWKILLPAKVPAPQDGMLTD